jgi:hypothetical protein
MSILGASHGPYIDILTTILGSCIVSHLYSSMRRAKKKKTNPRAWDARLYGLAYYGYYIGVEATSRKLNPGRTLGPVARDLCGKLHPSRCRHNLETTEGVLSLFFNTRGPPVEAHELLYMILPNLHNIAPQATVAAIVHDKVGGWSMTKPMTMGGTVDRCVIRTGPADWRRELQDTGTRTVGTAEISHVVVVVTGVPPRTWLVPTGIFQLMGVPIAETCLTAPTTRPPAPTTTLGPPQTDSRSLGGEQDVAPTPF